MEGPRVKLRGYAALGTVCLGLLAADVVQRLVIAPWVRLRPRQRVSVLGPWQHLLARFVLGSVSRIGGGAIPAPSRLVPAEPGDRKSTRLNSSHSQQSRMPSSA